MKTLKDYEEGEIPQEEAVDLFASLDSFDEELDEDIPAEEVKDEKSNSHLRGICLSEL